MTITTSTKIVVSQGLSRRSEMSFGDLAVRTGWNSPVTKAIKTALEAGEVYDMGEGIYIKATA